MQDDLDQIYASLSSGSAEEPPQRHMTRGLRQRAFEACRSESPDDRVGALRVGEALGAEHLLAIAHDLLRDPEPEVRQSAFASVIECGEAGRPVMRAFAEGADTELAVDALERLTDSRDHGSVVPARRLLGSADPSVRAAAARLLATVGGPSSLPALRKVAEADEDDEVRRAAAAAGTARHRSQARWRRP